MLGTTTTTTPPTTTTTPPTTTITPPVPKGESLCMLALAIISFLSILKPRRFKRRWDSRHSGRVGCGFHFDSAGSTNLLLGVVQPTNGWPNNRENAGTCYSGARSRASSASCDQVLAGRWGKLRVHRFVSAFLMTDRWTHTPTLSHTPPLIHSPWALTPPHAHTRQHIPDLHSPLTNTLEMISKVQD